MSPERGAGSQIASGSPGPAAPGPGSDPFCPCSEMLNAPSHGGSPKGIFSSSLLVRARTPGASPIGGLQLNRWQRLSSRGVKTWMCRKSRLPGKPDELQ